MKKCFGFLLISFVGFVGCKKKEPPPPPPPTQVAAPAPEPVQPGMEPENPAEKEGQP